MGQLLQLSNFPPLSGVETAVVLLSIVCYSVLLTCVAAAIGGLFRSAIAWMLLLAASTIYLFDYFSYSWLSAHLDDTIPLLIQNVRTDFQVMRSKMTAVIAAAAVFALLLIAGASAIRYGRCTLASPPGSGT